MSQINLNDDDYSTHNQSKLKKAFEEFRKDISENNKNFISAIKDVHQEQASQLKDYNDVIAVAKDNTKASSEFRKIFFGATEKDKYNTNLYYEQQKQAVRTSNLSDVSKNALTANIETQQGDAQKKNSQDGLFGKTLDRASAEFSDSMADIIMGYKSFSESMKSIGADLCQYMLKQLTDSLMQMILQSQNLSFVSKTGGLFGNWAGGLGGSFMNFIGALFPKHHSGGIVPTGANTELPGTEEQLALLKGGERILSPSENTDYKSSGSGSAPVVFNNFNIKAWDSKDVQKYLLENKQLLNSITYDGIKNNDSQLRHIVQNA